MAGDEADPAQEGQRDAALIRRMAEGDRSALGELFDLHADVALGVARRILKNRQDAEDLVHDVFLEAWNKASTYDPERAGVRAWLVVRTRSRAIDRLRALEAARRHLTTEMNQPEPPADAKSDPATRLDAERARKALDSLNPEQRSVVELAYFSGLTLREIAQERSIPLGTVKSRLAAALSNLRDLLDSDPRRVAMTGGQTR